MQSFDESRFQGQVDRALKTVKTVLDNNRVPQYAADVPHAYGEFSYFSRFSLLFDSFRWKELHTLHSKQDDWVRIFLWEKSSLIRLD